MDFKQQIAGALSPLCGIEAKELANYLEVPKNTEMGDYAFPCFKLSRTLRKAPPAIAQELYGKLVLPQGITRCEAVGGYLNFFVDRGQQAGQLLLKVLQEGKAYGSSQEGQGRHVVLDYSSINIAKPFSFHHLPTTAIGNSLYRIYRHLGYAPVGINHLGDWGTQFGKMIVAYKKWGTKPVEEYAIRELVDLYVRYHKEAEAHPEMDDEARAWFHKIETGDPEAVHLWQSMKMPPLRKSPRLMSGWISTLTAGLGKLFMKTRCSPLSTSCGRKASAG